MFIQITFMNNSTYDSPTFHSAAYARTYATGILSQRTRKSAASISRSHSSPKSTTRRRHP
jgi:hypothetical protein